jgi:glycosyltransferase involved in cell wall biosynthesis
MKDVKGKQFLRVGETVNVLIFTCFNSRSIQLESSIYFLMKQGYNVRLLTTCAKGPLHFSLEKKGIVSDSLFVRENLRLLIHLIAILRLIQYTRKNKIHFIQSHLQMPNLISSICSFFVKAEVYNFRHNSDVIDLQGSSKERLIEKLINRFSSRIIAISDKVEEQLVVKEKVRKEKVWRINNGYDFSNYSDLSLNKDEYQRIRAQYECDMLIVSPGRLISTKRHQQMIQVVKILRDKGVNSKLLILGDGPQYDSLQRLISALQLQNHVFLLGYHENISDYLQASDLVALLSISEASNNVIKEAGYFEKPVIVCSDVGDFSDYVVNGVNGVLLDKVNPVPDCVVAIEELVDRPTWGKEMGKRLRKTVLENFDISVVGKRQVELMSISEKKWRGAVRQ